MTGRSLDDHLEDLRDEYRKTHVFVRTDGEWIAYRPGIRRRWDAWRAIQMLGGIESDRVGTKPAAKTAVPGRTPPPVETPDHLPEEWTQNNE